nr:MAG TPA: hypothetical protein [Caudoviricetes sp.]
MNISFTSNLPISIAFLSEPSLRASSIASVTSFLKIISSFSISAYWTPSLSITGIPFFVIFSTSILFFLACKAPSGIILNEPPSLNFYTSSSVAIIGLKLLISGIINSSSFSIFIPCFPACKYVG